MDARFFLSSANHFIEHPDSIAGRLARWRLDRVLNQLSKRTGIGQWPAQPIPDNCPKRLRLRSAAIIPDCPLGSCWRDWDMFGTLDKYFRFVSDEQKAQCQEARVRAPSRHLGRIGLEWEATWIEPGVGNRKGTFDGHVHAEATIETRLVHIDIVRLTKWGPGRSILEVRIFVDGELAGRGGSAGCSLGFGGSDLPAVAILSGSTVLSVAVIHGRGTPVVELWETS
jgi:hypothetical protein